MKNFHYINNISEDIRTTKLLKGLVSEKLFNLITQTNTYPLIEHSTEHDLFIFTLPVYVEQEKLLKAVECNILIVGRDVYLMTNQQEPLIDNIIIEVEKNRNEHHSTTYSLILEFNTHILSTIDTLERVTNQFLSATLQSEEYTETTVKDIMKLKLMIGTFKSTIGPLTKMIKQFFEKVNHPDEATRITRNNYLSYMLEQITAKTRYLYENSFILADTSNSIQNIRANNIMKILTIISSIFIPLSFITGVFGMNFEVNNVFAGVNFYITLAIMLFIGGTMYIVFRYKKRF